MKSWLDFQVVRKTSLKLCRFPLASLFLVLCYLGSCQETGSVFLFGFPFASVPVVLDISEPEF